MSGYVKLNLRSEPVCDANGAASVAMILTKAQKASRNAEDANAGTPRSQTSAGKMPCLIEVVSSACIARHRGTGQGRIFVHAWAAASPKPVQ